MRCSMKMTMTGTAVGQMTATVAVRFTTTIMFTYPIRRFHHAATILRTDLRIDLRTDLLTGRGESAALVKSAA